MSRESIEAIRRGLIAFNERDRGAWLALCQPTMENVPPKGWPESDAVMGPDAVYDFFVANNEIWADGGRFSHGEIVELEGSRVLAEVRADLHGEASGAAVTWSYWQLVSTTGMRVDKIEWYLTREEAFEAAGLAG